MFLFAHNVNSSLTFLLGCSLPLPSTNKRSQHHRESRQQQDSAREIKRHIPAAGHISQSTCKFKSPHRTFKYIHCFPQCVWKVNKITRMHSSRMRTDRCSAVPKCQYPGVWQHSPPTPGVRPPRPPSGGSPPPSKANHPHGQTDASENVTFPCGNKIPTYQLLAVTRKHQHP